MLDSEVSAQRRNASRAVRWGLIALCGGIILFSSNMSARLGFAALLALAIIVGRYASRRRSRVLETTPGVSSTAPSEPARIADADLPRARNDSG